MKVTKEAKTGKTMDATEEKLALINRYSKKQLTAEDVFIFDIKLCDNEVDRDSERFSKAALEGLAELFVGKTGIFDHEWSAKGQVARIFAAEVCEEPERSTIAGECYAYLKASAYMLRAGNKELIAQIEGGIKREVSVGCSVKSAVCSICGRTRDSGKCGHTAGEVYDGKTCYFTLEEPEDAYEWSFVAVPAQKEAGVIKKFGKKPANSIEKLLDEGGSEKLRKEYEEIKLKAAAGERYLAGLREQVVKLGVKSGVGFEEKLLKNVCEKLSEDELQCFKGVFERRLDESFPMTVQLKGKTKVERFSDEEFLI
jgi:hypothetical protein